MRQIDKFKDAIKFDQHPLNWPLNHWYNKKPKRWLEILWYRLWRFWVKR